VISHVTRDEAVVVALGDSAQDQGSVYTFNEAGARLWALVESGRNATDLGAYLRSEYELSPEQAAADAEEFLAGLVKEGLAGAAPSR
jgi:hypothetical protein